MANYKSFQHEVINIEPENFNSLALEIFNYQAKNNTVYARYVNQLGIIPGSVEVVAEIPFLPVSMFKNHEIKTGQWKPEDHYKSSGTTIGKASRHWIRDKGFYFKNALKLFEDFFGRSKDYTLLALLPSYLEQKDSSLVAMVGHFIRYFSKDSGFYLNNYDELIGKIEELKGRKVILWGVTFALLELANYNPDLSNCIVIETGGMKGRRREIIKDELYRILRDSFNVDNIYSEYGMTEILSQSYAKNGKFINSSTMKVLIRDVNDPFSYVSDYRTGGINVIDLANIHSCSFIETMDLGRYNVDETYEILGRFDNSDIRGCNLLLSI